MGIFFCSNDKWFVFFLIYFFFTSDLRKEVLKKSNKATKNHFFPQVKKN